MGILDGFFTVGDLIPTSCPKSPNATVIKVLNKDLVIAEIKNQKESFLATRLVSRGDLIKNKNKIDFGPSFYKFYDIKPSYSTGSSRNNQ